MNAQLYPGGRGGGAIRRAVAAGLSLLPGFAAAAMLLGMAWMALLALFHLSSGDGGLAAIAARTLREPYLRGVILFTLWQAVLSTACAVLLAAPVARALHRRRFRGRRALLGLFAVCSVLPPVIVTLGLVDVHGAGGWLRAVLEPLGASPPDGYLYGLFGIVMAQVLFDMPLIALGLLRALNAVPGEQWRLAGHLGMRGGAIFRFVEWPAMRAALPGLAGLMLLLCLANFAVALTLGGGPAATTMQVAIYQMLRFDLDFGGAAALSCVQVVLCVAVAMLVLRGGGFGRSGEAIRAAADDPWALLMRQDAAAPKAHPFGHPSGRPDAHGVAGRVADALVLLLALALVLPPLTAVLTAGGCALLVSPETIAAPGLWRSVGDSLRVGLPAGMLAAAMGFALLAAARRLTLRLDQPRLAAFVRGTGSLILILPPFVLAAGLFILLRHAVGSGALAWAVVVVVNACMALPFVIYLTAPAWNRAGRAYDGLCRSLGMGGWNRFRLVDWPMARRPVLLALALAVCLSFGDLGVAALFGTESFAPLPLYIHRALGAYRMADAAWAGLTLAALCLAAVWLADVVARHAGRRAADA